MSLCQSDRDLLALWEELGGVPEDRSTRDFVADRLIWSMWLEIKQGDALVAEIAAKGLEVPS